MAILMMASRLSCYCIVVASPYVKLSSGCKDAMRKLSCLSLSAMMHASRHVAGLRKDPRGSRIDRTVGRL
jgi:hypothetical protein